MSKADGTDGEARLAELERWHEVERVVLEEVFEQTATVVAQLRDDSAQRRALKTVVSLLRVALGGRYLTEPFPAPTRAADEDVVLDEFADRLAVLIEWLPGESSWEGALRLNLSLLDSLAERGED